MKRLLFSLLIAGAATAPALALAQSALPPQLYPLVFSVEGNPLRTEACISTVIRHTEMESWWRTGVISATLSPADASLVTVMDAIKRHDRPSLLAASHSAHGRDPKKFDEQAKALFSQIDALGSGIVQYAFAFDDPTVYYLRFETSGKRILAPFIFEIDVDGVWRYLPYRTDALAFELLHDWVRSPFGPGNGTAPVLCSAAEVAKLRLAIPLGGAARPGAVRSHIHLNAEAPPTSPKALAAASAFYSLQKAAAGGQFEIYAAGLTPGGRKRFRSWYAGATEAEKTVFRMAIDGMRPLAAFELAPVIALVLRGPHGRTETAYFLNEGGHPPLMVNSTHISTVDRVFKNRSGPVLSSIGTAGQNLKQWTRVP